MYKVKKVKSQIVFPIIQEMLQTGQTVSIIVTGMSMYPFLREYIDRVELSPTSFREVQLGDIVLIIRDEGEYVLHRVCRKEGNEFYIVGDAQRWIEGPLRPDQLIAMVTTVWRENKQIDCSKLLWRLSARIWLKLLPHRYTIMRIYSKFKKSLKLDNQGEF